jgi:8-oxo-dGTP pyrophosphatase MutT (NUDIX family)
MSLMDRVAECSQFEAADFRPFVVAGQPVGLIAHSFADVLAGFPDVFLVTGVDVTLDPALDTHDARSTAVADVLRRLARQGMVNGWRDEPYPVAAAVGQPPLMTMERAAIPLFGVCAAGIHVNGIVRRPDGLAMWIGRRSLNKANSPGKLDQLVAGGQGLGYSVRQTMIKESAEEAGIAEALAQTARPVGAITYRTMRPEGLRRDTIYVFDLELPPDFVPRNQDGEIAEFFLWPLDRVIATCRETDQFKFNCALVIIDFLLRHARLDPDDADYLPLVRALHQM